MKALSLAFLLSLVAQGAAIVFFWWVGQMMGLTEIPISTYIIVVPLGFIVTALPLAPAGIGVGQAAFLFLFNLVTGEPTPLGATAVTLFQMSVFAFGLLGALFYLRQREQLQGAIEHG